MTYRHMYSGWSLVETRNGSDQVIKQHVWGLTYIDELIQIAANGDPVDDPEFDDADPDHDFRGYYAMQDANFNVLGITDDEGVLVERYEYTPYGKRTVFVSVGNEDPNCDTPNVMGQRVNTSGVAQAYKLNNAGYQGLMHDDIIELVYNRMRMKIPHNARFAQRDPIKYRGGMSFYQVVNSQPITYMDPSGLIAITITGGISDTDSNTFDFLDDELASVPGGVLPVHNSDGTACDQVQEAICTNPAQPVIIVGYSWGGAAAVELAKCLNDKNIDVDLLITIDIINKPLWDQSDHIIPDNVGVNINFWQDNDWLLDGGPNTPQSPDNTDVINIPLPKVDGHLDVFTDMVQKTLKTSIANMLTGFISIKEPCCE